MSIKNQARKLRKKKFICEECGSIGEVFKSTTWWTAWGRNCFDFNWAKYKGSKKLCEKCEADNWVLCEYCGALIEEEHYTHDWPDDYNGPVLCPECLPEYFRQKRIERKIAKSKRSCCRKEQCHD